MSYNKESLIKRQEEGEVLDFILFFGSIPSLNGEVVKTCFSQWWVASFKDENNVSYLTAEHYMMAAKARLFNDDETLAAILIAQHPKEVKKLGRNVSNFDEVTWDEHKFDIVVKGNLFKFSQNKNLKSFLLSTQNKILVEASPFDRIWGIGLGETNPIAKSLKKWKGDNLLGFALMEVRNILLTQNG
jgi:ribA/ribD-fused uncharacterized protein